jgi:hypothetical protein
LKAAAHRGIATADWKALDSKRPPITPETPQHPATCILAGNTDLLLETVARPVLPAKIGPVARSRVRRFRILTAAGETLNGISKLAAKFAVKRPDNHRPHRH